MEIDLKKALDYYQQAEERGDAEGMYYLARCYARGQGVEPDKSRARELCEKALQSKDLENERDERLRERLAELLASLEG